MQVGFVPHAVPEGDDRSKIMLATWAAPALPVARKMLQGALQSLGPTIRDTWKQAHHLIMHEQCRKLPGSAFLADEKPSPCLLAGICLCSRAGLELMAFAKSWASALRLPLQPDSTFRKHYDSGTAMVELHVSSLSTSWFYHLSYLNLDDQAWRAHGIPGG